MPESGPATERLIELKRRLEDDPSSPIFLQLAEEYRRMGQMEEGLKVLEEGLRRNPSYLSAQVSQARCLLDLGRTAQAVPVLEQVLVKDATQMVARKLLVEAFLRQAHPVRARRELDLYSAINPSDREIETLRTRIDDLQLAELVPSRRLVAEPSPPGIAAPPMLSSLVGSPQPSSTAASDDGGPFAQLLRAPSRSAHLHALAAEGIFVWHEAVEEAPAAELAPAPSPPVAALPPVELEEEPGSDPWLENLAASPAPPAPTATLGRLYLAQGHVDEAEQIFRTVLAEDPGNPQAVEGLERLGDVRLAMEPHPSSVATELTAGDSSELEPRRPAESDLSSQKAQALRRYLNGLRQTAERHVS